MSETTHHVVKSLILIFLQAHFEVPQRAGNAESRYENVRVNVIREQSLKRI